eukprot:COSAG02_NODE_6924_length_3285_cov_1.475204_4_plen_33_part_00
MNLSNGENVQHGVAFARPQQQTMMRCVVMMKI